MKQENDHDQLAVYASLGSHPVQVRVWIPMEVLSVGQQIVESRAIPELRTFGHHVRDALVHRQKVLTAYLDIARDLSNVALARAQIGRIKDEAVAWEELVNDIRRNIDLAVTTGSRKVATETLAVVTTLLSTDPPAPWRDIIASLAARLGGIGGIGGIGGPRDLKGHGRV